MLRLSRKLVLAIACVELTACQHPLVYQWVKVVLEGNPQYLHEELVTLPAEQPVRINATFLAEEPTEALVNGRTSERWGAPFQLRKL